MKLGVAVLLTLTLVSMLVAAALQISGLEPDPTLQTLVRENLERSGVAHPVTAVLLNFRAYDTLLEIAVLVVAGVAGLALSGSRGLAVPTQGGSDVLLHALERWFVPFMLLLACWLLWAGSFRPGGAFQAGAVLAATGVLMRLGGIPAGFIAPGLMLRLGLVLGFSVFLLVAVSGALVGQAFLAYPTFLTGTLILFIEAVLTLSIAMVLLGLFAAAPPNAERAGRDGA